MPKIKLPPKPVLSRRRVDVAEVRRIHLLKLERMFQYSDALVDAALRRALKPVTAKLAQPKLLVAAGPSPEAYLSLDDAGVIKTTWRDEVTDLMRMLQQSYTAGGVSAARSVGGAFVQDLYSPAAERYLAEAENRLLGVGDAMWTDVRAQLLQGFQNGDSITKMRSSINDVAGFTSARATAIARTEIIGASNAGGHQQAMEQGVSYKTWLATADERTRLTHLDMDGTTVAVDDYFDFGDGQGQYPGDPNLPPEEAINCVIGSTLIDAQGIDVAMRSWFDGEIIELCTAAGLALSVTPNHPVLTLAGWKSAGELQVGDHVLRCEFRRRGLSGGEHDEQRRPTVIAELYDASSVLDDARGVREARADFHGERRVSQVCVVPQDRNLHVPSSFVSAEELEEFALTAAHRSRARECTGERGLDAISTTIIDVGDHVLTPSSLRSQGVSSVLLDRKLSVKSPVRLGTPGPGKSMFAQDTSDRRSLDIEITRDSSHGFMRGVLPKNFGDVNCQSSSTISFDADQLVSVKRTTFRGHAYNLSTTGEWYTGNTIIVHNCRCTLTWAENADGDTSDYCACTPDFEALTSAGDDETSVDCDCLNSESNTVDTSYSTETPYAFNLYMDTNAEDVRDSASAREYDAHTRDALGDYRNFGYLDINRMLRAGDELSPEANSIRAGMDDAFKNAVLTDREIVVYRSADEYESAERFGTAGAKAVDAGFTSVTTDINVLENEGLRDAGAVLRITVPEGTPVVSGTSWEKELILPRNSKFESLGPGRFWTEGPTRSVIEYETEMLKVYDVRMLPL